MQLGSGFNIQLKYARDVQVSGDVIGLNDDLDLTTPLAKFLELNRHLISTNIRRVEKVLTGYRHYQRKECRWKRRVLSYQFLSAVYDRPRIFTPDCVEHEHDIRVRQLVCEHREVLNAVYERFIYVTRTEASAWWYIFWVRSSTACILNLVNHDGQDDLWRRNNAAVKSFTLYATDFNPYYPTSIAYTPLPRPALENFLTQRGLLSRENFFHTGILNKIYTRLYEIAFRSSKQVRILSQNSKQQFAVRTSHRPLSFMSEMGVKNWTWMEWIWRHRDQLQVLELEMAQIMMYPVSVCVLRTGGRGSLRIRYDLVNVAEDG